MSQYTFLEKIKNKLNNKASLIDEIATALDISYDAAYRRACQKSKLSLEEGVILAKYFGISIDQLFTDKKERIVAVKKTIPINNEENLLQYYIDSYQSLAQLTNISQVEIIYSAKDIPIFYTSGDNKLSQFKMYVWLKIVDQNRLNMKFADFTPSLSLIEAAKKLEHVYKNINSTEIWDITTINSTLKQIHYYYESNALTIHEATSLCDDLKNLIQKIAEKIITRKDNFKLYYNELLLMNNTVLVETPIEKLLYIPFTILSYFRTNDIETCNQAGTHLKTQMKSSKLLTSSGEKERSLFFNKMFKKIDALRSLIAAQDILEFE